MQEILPSKIKIRRNFEKKRPTDTPLPILLSIFHLLYNFTAVLTLMINVLNSPVPTWGQRNIPESFDNAVLSTVTCQLMQLVQL